MNLSKLFEMQAKLDAHIERKHPRKENEDRLAKKILAFQVELGELCNCWRGFKFWSNDQKPRTVKYIENRKHRQNPLLEEYVDCLHFILSIGLELGLTNWKPSISSVAVHFGGNELITQFEEVFWYASSFGAYTEDEKDTWYSMLFSNFLGLGKMLGFTWEQIEQAYREKNAVNHQRQAEGY